MTYTHPHMPVIHMETAVELLGQEIAQRVAAREAIDAPAADKARMVELVLEAAGLRKQRDALRATDRDQYAKLDRQITECGAAIDAVPVPVAVKSLVESVTLEIAALRKRQQALRSNDPAGVQAVFNEFDRGAARG